MEPQLLQRQNAVGYLFKILAVKLGVVGPPQRRQGSVRLSALLSRRLISHRFRHIAINDGKAERISPADHERFVTVGAQFSVNRPQVGVRGPIPAKPNLKCWPGLDV
jgi:hypothetical protein